MADLLVLTFEGSYGSFVTALVGPVYSLIGWNGVSIAVFDPTLKVLPLEAHLKHTGQPACKLPAHVPVHRLPGRVQSVLTTIQKP